MSKWFSFDKFEGIYEFHDTEEEAKKEVENSIDHYYGEGIPEDLTGQLGYGKVVKSVVQKTIAEKEKMTKEEWSEKGYSGEFDYIYELKLESEGEE